MTVSSGSGEIHRDPRRRRRSIFYLSFTFSLFFPFRLRIGSRLFSNFVRSGKSPSVLVTPGESPGVTCQDKENRPSVDSSWHRTGGLLPSPKLSRARFTWKRRRDKTRGGKQRSKKLNTHRRETPRINRVLRSTVQAVSLKCRPGVQPKNHS